MPWCLLSNFVQLKTCIVVDGLKYASAEHAFQASLLRLRSDRIKYTVDGEIGTLCPDAFKTLGYSNADANKACAYWAKKNMVGVLAKMAIARDKKAGLTRDIDARECYRIFYDILVAKFDVDKEAREALLATGTDTYLLEFVRSAGRRFKNHNDIERWGGMIDSSGCVIGHNQMGQLMSTIRSRFANRDGSITSSCSVDGEWDADDLVPIATLAKRMRT